MPDERELEAERAQVIGRTIGVVLAGVWLVFLIEPISQTWARRDEPAGLVGLLSMLAFAAVYLWHFIAPRRWGGWSGRQELSEEEQNRLRRGWAHRSRYGLLVVFALVSVVAAGQPGSATWVFLAVAGLFTFSLRVAMALGVFITMASLVASYRVPGWTPDASTPLSTILALIAVGAGVLAGKRQRVIAAMREENSRLQMEEERGRVARDLHDILGHSLTVISVKADLASRIIDADPKQARAELADIQRLSRDALADVRHTIAGIRELSLPAELARARSALAAAQIEADIPTAADEVRGEHRDLFAWTVREAVTNVLRHSGADRCWIELSAQEVRVSDDGRGMAVDQPVEGKGLRGLRERAAQVGARVVTEALEPHGFRVIVLAGTGGQS